MRTRWMAALLSGAVALSLAACGNQSNHEDTGSTVSTGKETGSGENAALLKESPYQALYNDSLFFGDSITEGLSFQELLDEKNVLGLAGETANLALESKADEKIASRNPKQLFIMLGQNDMLWPKGDPKELTQKSYAELIQKIKTKLPDTNVYMLSITPVTEEALKEEPRYKHIDEYNATLKELADKENVQFIDLSPLFKQNHDFYDTDGIHFKAEFYKLLLDELKVYAK